MIDTNSVVAIFDSHSDAEAAIDVLRKGGVDVTTLSIVGRDYHTKEQVVGYYNAGDRMKSWGKLGAFWGGLWGLLMGAAVLVIPGLGPVVVAGPFAAVLIGALESAVAVGGAGVIGAALYSLGIPKNSVLRYEDALTAEQFLLLLRGTADQVTRAHELLRTTRATTVDTHAQPVADETLTAVEGR